MRLAEADRAARLDKPDWQSLQKLRNRGLNLLLPEVQQIRSVARALQVRLRAEIAQGRFDDAIRTAKTMFAIARHLGENPTLIGNLVGIAVAVDNRESISMRWCSSRAVLTFTGRYEPAEPACPAGQGHRRRAVSLAWVFDGLDAGTPMSKEQLKNSSPTSTSCSNSPTKRPTSRRAGWLDARTKDEAWSVPLAAASSNTASRRSGCRDFRPIKLCCSMRKRELEIRFDDVLKTYALSHLADRPAQRPEHKSKNRTRHYSPMP